MTETQGDGTSSTGNLDNPNQVGNQSEVAGSGNPFFIEVSEVPNHYPGTILTGGLADAVLRKYQEAGKNLQNPEIPEDETFVTDGLVDEKFDTSLHVIRDRFDPAAVQGRLNNVGKYDTTENIAYINGQGQLMYARHTLENASALRNAGYRENTEDDNTFYVPYSNGSPLEDTPAATLVNQWTELDQDRE